MALKKTEIDKFRKRLESMHAEMTKILRGSTAEIKRPDESTGYSQHQADQGTDDFDKTISLEVTGREYEIIRQIERSLEKIKENTYGICDITGKDIPLKRLEAVPYANMTVEAQDKLEKGLI